MITLDIFSVDDFSDFILKNTSNVRISLRKGCKMHLNLNIKCFFQNLTLLSAFIKLLFLNRSTKSFAFLSIVKSQSAVKSTLWLFYEDNSMERRESHKYFCNSAEINLNAILNAIHFKNRQIY